MGDCGGSGDQDVSQWPAFKKMLTPELVSLVSYFDKHGHQIRIAGGAVRDLVSGAVDTIHDVDLATTATPDEMIAMFEQEQVRTINEQGVKHGTVTARIVLDPVNNPDAGENFEVTTLRVDGPTVDGRRPTEVEFTKNWRLDAERRDLTINSMFLDFEGKIIDYFEGRNDLKNKRVVFVGNADKRIKEDYLRILRYFRFYGRIAVEADNHDPETMAAIEANAAGMEKISGERKWTELKKILTGNHAAALMRSIHATGLFAHIGLPENPDLDEMRRVSEMAAAKGLKLSAATLLASLVRNSEEMMTAHATLKLSGLERDTGLFIVEKQQRGSQEEEPLTLKTLKCWWVDHKTKNTATVKAIIEEVVKYKGDEQLLKEFQSTECPRLPINGQDLRELGCPNGMAMGFLMNKLKDSWKDSDFSLGKEELMAMVTSETIDDMMDKQKAASKAQKAAAKAKKRKNSNSSN